MIKRIVSEFLKRVLIIWNWFKRDRRRAPPMSIADIEPGDILLFSGESMISELIKALSGGGESHAAMAYSDPDTLVHEVPEHAQTGCMSRLFDGRTVSVMRVNNRVEAPDTDQIMRSAASFVAAEEPYPMSTIYLLGLMIIYRRLRPDAKRQKYEAMIIRRMISEIEAYIAQRKYPGQLPMVCSQFVHECYKRGGVSLPIKNGVLLGAVKSGEQSLLDKVSSQLDDVKLATFSPSPLAADSLGAESDTLSNEELAGRLLASPDDDGSSELSPALQIEVLRLGEIVHTAVNGGEPYGPLAAAGDRLHASNFGMQWLQENESLFVTPADLLFHCNALDKVGIVRC